MENLAGFMCWMATLDKLNGYVYYTDKLSINVKTLPINKRIQFIKQPYIEKNYKINNDFIIDLEKFAYQKFAQFTCIVSIIRWMCSYINITFISHL